ncbi:D-glycero-beta-D-manno-heptose-7-phosphate kinase [Arenicella xantha]|uniref:D-alpha,beta-D-heptose 7-phosphate 1-kinase n=1 Tax=Arenicella xantha TaxID=644221 RepID=A0A395JHL6_9GAMM|nr:D-glycero-beta-D-manno-heptose-7-phosphate kinase [Arenicella xantha]RBP48349.1 D-alpha,beta-D-heptose 7-phosphate 1-kinase [Arenicella xantha]
MASLKITPDHFFKVRTLVVGDVMLDRYWFGRVDRISPEAPVPVLAVQDEQARAGGAANVAHNLLALGAQSHLLSVVGDDEAGREIKRIIDAYGARTTLKIDASIRTIVKLRMVAQNQQLLRADFEEKPSEEVLAQCLEDYTDAVNDADVVILSDYGKGGLTHVATMIAIARERGKAVIVDPKGSDYSRYRGASLITPNMKEFEAVAGVASSEADFIERAHTLRNELDLDRLLVTRSEQGMSLFGRDGSHIHSPATALEVYDVSGAGDTVISLMALATVSDFNDEETLTLANTVAGIVVGKLGTAVAEIDEVISKLETSE